QPRRVGLADRDDLRESAPTTLARRVIWPPRPGVDHPIADPEPREIRGPDPAARHLPAEQPTVQRLVRALERDLRARLVRHVARHRLAVRAAERAEDDTIDLVDLFAE